MLGAARVQALSPFKSAPEGGLHPSKRHHHASPAKTNTLAPPSSSTSTSSSITAVPSAPSSSSKSILRVQLLPLDDSSSHQVSSAGCNPLLQLNVQGSFLLSSVIRSVQRNKWSAVAGIEQLRLQPPSSHSDGSVAVVPCPPGGWGLKEGRALSLEAVHKMLGCPTPFRLTYTLPSCGAEEAVTSQVAPVQPVAAPVSAAPIATHGANSHMQQPMIPVQPAAPDNSSTPAPLTAASTPVSVPFPAATPQLPAAATLLQPQLQAEMLRLLSQHLPAAQAQTLFSSMLNLPAAAALATASTPNVAAAPAPAPTPSHQLPSQPSLPHTPSAAAVAPLPQPAAPRPPPAKSLLPPSTFSAYEPSSASKGGSSFKKPRLSATPAFHSTLPVVPRLEAQGAELYHKQPSRSINATLTAASPVPQPPLDSTLPSPAAVDSPDPLPPLPTASPSPQDATAAPASHSLDALDDNMPTPDPALDDMDESWFGGGEEVGFNASGSEASAEPPAAAASSSASHLLPPLLPASSTTPSRITPSRSFISGPFCSVLRQSAKKSLFQDFMNASTQAMRAMTTPSRGTPGRVNGTPRRTPFAAAAAGNGAGSHHRNIQFGTPAAAAAASSSTSPCAASLTSSTGRVPLSTLYSTSPDSALNISNNLTSSSSGLPTPLSHRPGGVDQAASALAAGRVAPGKENQPPAAPADAAACAPAVPAPVSLPSSAPAALSIRSPTKLAFLGWNDANVALLHALDPSTLPPIGSSHSAAASSSSFVLHTPVRQGSAAQQQQLGSGSQDSVTTHKSGKGKRGANSATKQAKGSGGKNKSSTKKDTKSKPVSDRKRKRGGEVEATSAKKSKKTKADNTATKKRSSAKGKGKSKSKKDECAEDAPLDDDMNWDAWAEELEKELSSDETETDPSSGSSESSGSPQHEHSGGEESEYSPMPTTPSEASTPTPPSTLLDMDPLPSFDIVDEHQQHHSSSYFDSQEHEQEHTTFPSHNGDWMQQPLVMPPSNDEPYMHSQEQVRSPRAAHHEEVHMQPEEDGFMHLLRHNRSASPAASSASSASPPPSHTLPSSSPPTAPLADLDAPQYQLDQELDQLLEQCGGDVNKFIHNGGAAAAATNTQTCA